MVNRNDRSTTKKASQSLRPQNADWRISSEDRSQTRLPTLPISLSLGGWLDYEDLNIWGEALNTTDSSQSTRKFDFADDLALLSHTHEQMEMTISSVAAACALVGLNIHKGKSKILKYNKENTNPITLDGQTLEEVETFTYLGITIDEQGWSDGDVNTRKDKSRTTFLQLKNI